LKKVIFSLNSPVPHPPPLTLLSTPQYSLDPHPSPFAKSDNILVSEEGNFHRRRNFHAGPPYCGWSATLGRQQRQQLVGGGGWVTSPEQRQQQQQVNGGGTGGLSRRRQAPPSQKQ
jgi:hypothetical protein